MRMSEDDFDKVIAVNMKSVFNMTKSVQRTMLKQRSGSIINLSSIVGIRGNAGQSNYSASKAGIIGFTKSIALELLWLKKYYVMQLHLALLKQK